MKIDGAQPQLTANQVSKAQSKDTSNTSAGNFAEAYTSMMKNGIDGVKKITQGTRSEWLAFFKETAEPVKDKPKTHEESEMEEAYNILKKIEKILEEKKGQE